MKNVDSRLQISILQRLFQAFFVLLVPCVLQRLRADEGAIFEDSRSYHLRIDGPREWDSFSETADANALELRFDAQTNQVPYALKLRQVDVKQAWQVTLNTTSLGQLRIDENDMIVYFEIPANTLHTGMNTLRIEQPDANRSKVDDILLGDVAVLARSVDACLRESTVRIRVREEKSQQLIPSRLTILTPSGALQSIQVDEDQPLATRPGVVYTATGEAEFRLPAGDYTIFAGRGFEYSLASSQVTLKPGQEQERLLSIRRQVPTPGQIACDTHVHTLTFSGHGDASIVERMITLAGEGIELPVATDHNVNIDYRPYAETLGLNRFFTPVTGNEVTTRLGHFNVFPICPKVDPPPHDLDNWGEIFEGIYGTPGVRIAILNHGRDLHSGTRPLGPKLHNALVGENLRGWTMGMNGMEVLNSAATQSDPLQLCRDWMALLNRGVFLTPVGSSDSHDVARHFVGQGRTYIRCDDRQPGDISVEEAVDSFLAGRVSVSYGLLMDMEVDGKYSSGDLIRFPGDSLQVDLRVLGPHWTQVDRVTLYANGYPVRTAKISKADRDQNPVGVLWQDQWSVELPQHDVHLVAIATGPGITQSYWKTAKPYQPTSTSWEPRVMSCTGAMWVDVDRDGRRTCAREYAETIFQRAGEQLDDLLQAVSDYDAAIIIQAAHLYQSSGQSWLSPQAQTALQKSKPEVRQAISAYLDAWRETQLETY